MTHKSTTPPKGELIIREWDTANGLNESAHRFASLDELFAQCLAIGDPQLIDRVVIHGHDEHGRPRVLTFVFQSITVTPPKPTP